MAHSTTTTITTYYYTPTRSLAFPSRYYTNARTVDTHARTRRRYYNPPYSSIIILCQHFFPSRVRPSRPTHLSVPLYPIRAHTLYSCTRTPHPRSRSVLLSIPFILHSRSLPRTHSQLPRSISLSRSLYYIHTAGSFFHATRSAREGGRERDAALPFTGPSLLPRFAGISPR